MIILTYRVFQSNFKVIDDVSSDYVKMYLHVKEPILGDREKLHWKNVKFAKYIFLWRLKKKKERNFVEMHRNSCLKGSRIKLVKRILCANT